MAGSQVGALSAPFEPPFRPPFWGRGPNTQTILGLLPTRAVGKGELLRRSRAELIRLADGFCVQGFHAARPPGTAKGLVILLSGWEGHAHSPYMLAAGRTLYSQGYDIFRLNYPDHGDTQDLNESIFHFGMVGKILEALHHLLLNIRTRPAHLVGFSIGGNLSLNIACRGLRGLRSVTAVSPPVELKRALQVLERHRLFSQGFLRSWKRSLQRKQELFPHRYDFSQEAEAESLRTVVGNILLRYVGPPSLEEYYGQLALSPEKLEGLKLRSHIIAAEDDPVVGPLRYADYQGLSNLTLHVHPHGGHVGFSPGVFGRTWYEALLPAILGGESGARDSSGARSPATLTELQPGRQGTSHAVAAPAVLGTSSSAAIKLQGERVGENHGTIDFLDYEYLLRSAGTDPTYVNGRLIRCVALRHGDIIRVGTTNMVFEAWRKRELPGKLSAGGTLEGRTGGRTSRSHEGSQEEQRLKQFLRILETLMWAPRQPELPRRLIADICRMLEAGVGMLFQGRSVADLELIALHQPAGTDPFSLDKNLLNQVFRTGAPVLVADAALESGLDATSNLGALINTNPSLMCVPILRENEVCGLLAVCSERVDHPFQTGDLALLASLGRWLGVDLGWGRVEPESPAKLPSNV